MIDPSFVHGLMPRTHIGSLELTDAIKELLHIFEIPLHIARKEYMGGIQNSFTAFRACEESANLWQRYVSKQPKKGKPFDHTNSVKRVLSQTG